MERTSPTTTVLYVHEPPVAADVVTALETETGAAVRTAAGAEEAVELLDGEPDCLLSEHSPPELDGLAVLEAVRERDGTVPFVLYAREGSEQLAARALRRGVTDYVPEASADSHELLTERVAAALPGDTGRDGPGGGRTRQQSRKLIAALSATFPDSVYVYNEEGVYLDVILGRRRDAINTREELLGATVDDVFSQETAGTFRETIATVLDSGELGTIEYALEGETGTRWFEGALAPITDGYRGEPAVLLSARDITERKQRARALERKNEFLDEFAKVVSHDIATPLGVIENKAHLVEMTGDVSHVGGIYDATERVQTLIDELRELAQQGKQVGETTQVDLGAVAREAWQSVETEATALTVESSGVLEADRSRLRQLLENLLANAVEHGSTNGSPVTATVGTLPNGFYVADDGPGIPDEDRDQVFEQGYTTSRDGTGMGLAIVRRITAGHGWAIGIADGERDGDGRTADDRLGGQEATPGGARFEITGVEFVE
jgi:PAS domain S-box-containing protein